MRGCWLLGVGMLAGCDQLFNLDQVELDQPAPLDADVDANEGMLVDPGPCLSPGMQYGKYGDGATGLISVCVTTGAGALTLGTMTIDTDDNTQCDVVVAQDTVPNEVCVIAAASITVQGIIETRGVRPLVLVADTTLSVNGTIDVAAHGVAGVGAGSNYGSCGNPVNGAFSNSGGGGGAGGSFGSRGGNGGPSAAMQTVFARSAVLPDRVRGGCAGGRGGASYSYAPPAGGNGGGSVYLIASQTIALGPTAVINASGSGGRGGAGTGRFQLSGPGGGAGGSGGLIGLDAPTIAIDANAVLMANGGGGGAGGGVYDGPDGADPSVSAPRQQAQGGLEVQYGGGGGNGASINGDAQDGRAYRSGGGGGGGAGVIQLYTPAPPAMPTKVSPAWNVN